MAEEARLIELMIAYQRGQLDAFEQLYEMLAAEVSRYFARRHAHRPAIADLVQETFLEVHRSRRTYTPPLPVRPWIFGIARNISARSRHAARFEQQMQPIEPDAEFIGPPAQEVSPAEVLDTHAAIERLPRGISEPWLLHHAFGFSFESIAARLGITPMAAKLRSSRATKALRLALSVQLRRRR
jgi:RNA polymerase sigma-70 factor (ECF subfamily)